MKGSARDLHELRVPSSEWEASTLRHWYRAPLSASHPRTGRAQSEPQGRCAWDDVKRRGERSRRDPRALESLVVGFGRGRARSRPLREGVWRVVRGAVTRPHSDPRPEKGEPTQHNTEHASAHTHVLVTRRCSLRCFTSSTARRRSTAQCARKHLRARSTLRLFSRPPPPHHLQVSGLR